MKRLHISPIQKRRNPNLSNFDFKSLLRVSSRYQVTKKEVTVLDEFMINSWILRNRSLNAKYSIEKVISKNVFGFLPNLLSGVYNK